MLHFQGAIERKAWFRFAVLVTMAANEYFVAIGIGDWTGTDGDLLQYMMIIEQVEGKEQAIYYMSY